MKKLKMRADSEKLTAKTFLEPAAFLLPFLIGLVLFTLYPFINVILISFKENYKVLTGEFSAFGFANYQAVIKDPYFVSGLKKAGRRHE